MLRIVTDQQGDLCRVTLHGKIAGEWVPVLDRFWQRLAESVPSPRMTAVLSDVSFIDADGERLLERMSRQGVRLVASGCMNRHLVEQIQGRTADPGRTRRASRQIPPGGGGR